MLLTGSIDRIVAQADALSILCRPVGYGMGGALEPSGDSLFTYSPDTEDRPKIYTLSLSEIKSQWELVTKEMVKEEAESWTRPF